MTGRTTQRYEALARILQAMSSPMRLLFVDELSREKERCVYELAGLVDADMSTVSRHLMLLKEAGILADEKRGKMVYYHLRTKKVKSFFEFTECCLLNGVGN